MNRESGSGPYVIIRKIPFSQSIPCEGATQGSSAHATATVSEMSINVEESRILTDVGMILECIVSKNESVGDIKDVYSTEFETACKSKEVMCASEGGSFGYNFTLSDSVSLEESGISPGNSVVDLNGVAQVEDQVFEGGKRRLAGKTKFSVVFEKDGEYSVSDIELPFKYESDGHDASDSFSTAEIISARARIDGERIGIDAEVAVCGHCWTRRKLEMLDSVSFGDRYDGYGGDCIICYPSRDDSLWSVAKRYGAPLSRIIELNGLSDTSSPDSTGSIEGAGHLVIN